MNTNPNNMADMSTSSLGQSDASKNERRAKRFWVSLVVTLLGIQLLIGFVAIRLATGDPSAAIVPDYHNAALNWDVSQRAITAADRMGWTVSIATSDVADARGMRATEISILDDQDQPVDDLRIMASIYHHARAANVQTFAIESIGQGRYLTLAPMQRPGLWQMELMIEGAEQLIKKSSEITVL
ncbi:FixH [Rubripirellula tenax]|uniref:FixH n=1 Tax=Rubripirellula tenax TaxID=2528015 RepID=A0A5C6EEU3_9BACT|nr:FixH family protein [Rubripirellula tenax]TWU47348.1 FixH [Rubripirellula tenax]